MFRVVRCLPLPQDGRDTSKPSGQASYKPQGRKPRNAPARSGQRRSLWGLDARSLVERDALAGTLRSTIPPMPGYWLTPLHYLPLGATGNGALAA